MDQISIDEAINHPSQSQLVETHSDLYAGFQMINMFENKYPGALKNFLYYKNKTLYVMFKVRNECFADAKSDGVVGDIIDHGVSTATLKDTCEALACLGQTVVQECERKTYFEAKAQVVRVCAAHQKHEARFDETEDVSADSMGKHFSKNVAVSG